MPGRFIRDKLLGSDAWVNLPDTQTQLMFVRLILIADDFGCFDGRTEVIANKSFPTAVLGDEELSELQGWLDNLHHAGLIIRYRNKGRVYIGIQQWGNDLRGDRQFPAPPIDLDLETLVPRGKYGKDIGWWNPPGSDPVSVLLDPEGEPVIPQPQEWRPAWHLGPRPKKAKKGALVTGTQSLKKGQSLAASHEQLVTEGEGSVTDDHHRRLEEEVEVVLDVPPPPPPPPASQSSSSSSEPHARAREQLGLRTGNNGGGDGNGKILFDTGQNAWIGLTDAQQAHWQGMFTFPLPDQLERAGAWLKANRAEREAIERQGEGFEGFLVRWLLREARTHGT